MAGENQQTETRVLFPGTSGEYRFVTGVGVKAKKQVYLDFVQDNGGDPALGIVRLAMHPDVAADLLRKLSELQGES